MIYLTLINLLLIFNMRIVILIFYSAILDSKENQLCALLPPSCHILLHSFFFIFFYFFVRGEVDQRCKMNFSGCARCKRYRIVSVNFQSSGCASALPQEHVDPPLLITTLFLSITQF